MRKGRIVSRQPVCRGRPYKKTPANAGENRGRVGPSPENTSGAHMIFGAGAPVASGNRCTLNLVRSILSIGRARVKITL